jgi:hypothetical protein
VHSGAAPLSGTPRAQMERQPSPLHVGVVSQCVYPPTPHLEASLHHLAALRVEAVAVDDGGGGGHAEDARLGVARLRLRGHGACVCRTSAAWREAVSCRKRISLLSLSLSLSRYHEAASAPHPRPVSVFCGGWRAPTLRTGRSGQDTPLTASRERGGRWEGVAPISTNPKPIASMPSMHSAFLSKPAARPMGLRKLRPHTVVWRRRGSRALFVVSEGRFGRCPHSLIVRQMRSKAAMRAHREELEACGVCTTSTSQLNLHSKDGAGKREPEGWRGRADAPAAAAPARPA